MKLLMFAAALSGCLLANAASAALVITEVASTSGAPEAELSGLDWWEVTNTGPGAVSLDGYEWEDNNPSGFGNDTAVFPNGYSVSPGESIIIHQGDDAVPAAFRTAWGLSPAVQILSEDLFGGNNTFSGLSSGGDQLHLYNSAGTLVSMVAFGASASGVSFEWDRAGNSLDLSVVGENGAYAASDGRIGSPGAVPEPATLALAGLAACGVLARRRRS